MNSTNSQSGQGEAVNQNTARTLENTKTTSSENVIAVSEETEQGKEVPLEFRKIDFANFAFPVSGWKKGRIRLTEGTYEYANPEGGGGDTFDLKSVDFIDLTGDGIKDAFVQLLRVSCGGSCDGGSYLFYVYSFANNKLNLVWRIETGSLAYGCGLKSLEIDKRTATLEVFKDCRFKGVSLETEIDPEHHSFKFEAQAFTRFLFNVEEGRFILEKREVLPFAEGQVKNYRAKVSVSDD